MQLKNASTLQLVHPGLFPLSQSSPFSLRALPQTGFKVQVESPAASSVQVYPETILH